MTWTKQTILNQTADQLIYFLDYSQAVKTIYGGLGLFLSLIVYGGLAGMILGSGGKVLQGGMLLLMGGIALIPPGIVVALMQKVGFTERWTFQRSLGTILIERKLALGQQVVRYPSQGIQTVTVGEDVEAVDADDRYWVRLTSKTLNLWGQGAKGDRVLYTTSTLKKAQEFAALIQHYLALNSSA